LPRLAAQLGGEGRWRSTPSPDLLPAYWEGKDGVQALTHGKEDEKQQKAKVQLGEKQPSLGPSAAEQWGEPQHLKKWGCGKGWLKMFALCCQ